MKDELIWAYLSDGRQQDGEKSDDGIHNGRPGMECLDGIREWGGANLPALIRAMRISQAGGRWSARLVTPMGCIPRS